MLAAMYALYTFGVTIVRPADAPALPPEERQSGTRSLARQVAVALVPPLVLILLVLGSIFAGVATPTEAGALGAVGATLLAVANRRLNRKTLSQALDTTARMTTMVVFLLIGSTAFTLVFRGLYGDIWIESLLTRLPGEIVGFLIVANLTIFVLGFFIDFFEIAFIILPLLVPAAQALGIDLVWFGVIVGMNLQTSFLTPPFGFSLFYLRGVAPPQVSTGQIYRGVIPFVVIQLIGLVLILRFPQLVTALVAR
jgi:tripartite ATP-independent transporter DctM subunit